MSIELEAGAAASPDGVRIRYYAMGRGEPALVFAHGWAFDHRLWDSQVPALPGRHRVVTLDLAGHGSSGRERTSWTIEAFGEDVRAVVEALDLKRVVLVGHSMSGPVILEAALKMPGRVVGLIPVDTLLSVDEKPRVEEIQAFLAGFRADYKTAAAKFVRDWMVVPTTGSKLIERLVAQAAAAPAEVAISVLEAAWSYEAGPTLRQVKAPIRAINADKFPTDLDAARRYAPQFDAVIMNGVGHYLMLEDPQRFNGLLEEAVTAVAPDGEPSPGRAGGERAL